MNKLRLLRSFSVYFLTLEDVGMENVGKILFQMILYCFFIFWFDFMINRLVGLVVRCPGYYVVDLIPIQD